jgi:site-specific recombinase XerD
MRKSQPPVRRVSIDTMSKSLARTLRAEGKSEKTIYSYQLSVRLLSDFLADAVAISPSTCRKMTSARFIAEQGTRRKVIDGLGRVHHGGSPATAMVRFKSLQQFFRHCVEADELDVSPMASMRAPKVQSDPVPVVSDDVLSRLLKARADKTMDGRRDTAILRVFLDTGCRLAEVTNLKQSDVDVDAQTLRVVGKGGRVRHVTFGAKCAQAVERYLRLLEREQPDRVSDPDGWLWIGRQGRMSTSGLTDVLHLMCADAGVEQLHWHQLRHTFAHAWMAAGGNEGDLMSLAGWQSRAMLDRYAKSAQVERAHAASRRMSLGDRV